MNKANYLTYICIILFIFIPLYLLPTSAVNRFIFLNLFWIYIITNQVLHRYYGIGKEHWHKFPFRLSMCSFIKENQRLFIVLFLNLLVHVYPVVSRTILFPGDESTQVQMGLGLFTRASSIFNDLLPNEVVDYTKIFFIVLLFLLVIFRNKVKKFSEILTRFYGQHLIIRLSAYFALILISYSYFFIIRNLSFKDHLLTYPPMPRLLYLLSFTVFGVNEFAPRLIQVLLGSIGTVYIYRIILLYYEKRAALLGAIIFMFNPLVSHYFNYAELDLGTISFAIVISYYYIRFLQYSYDNDLLISYFLIGVGYLYKEPILLLLFLTTLHLLVVRRKYFISNYKKILKLLWLSLWPILFFWTIARNYTPSLLMDYSALFDHRFLIYIKKLPTQISTLMVVLLALATILIILKERNYLTAFLALMFIGFNSLLILKSDGYYIRYSIFLYPMIAVYISIFIYRLIGRNRIALDVFSVCIVVYLISISTFIKLPEIEPKLVLYKYFNMEHYPTDKVTRWININHRHGRILCLEMRGIAFYRDKYEINKEKIVAIGIRDFNQLSRDEIKDIIRSNNVSCIITTNGIEPIKNENIDADTFDSIKEFSYENGNKTTLYYTSASITAPSPSPKQ